MDEYGTHPCSSCDDVVDINEMDSCGRCQKCQRNAELYEEEWERVED